MEHTKVDSGDVGLSLSVFGVATLITQALAVPLWVRVIAAITIALSFSVVAQLSWAYVQPRIPKTITEYQKYCEQNGARGKASMMIWLLWHYPPRAIKSQLGATEMEHAEIAYLTLIAVEFVLGGTVGAWALLRLFGVA